MCSDLSIITDRLPIAPLRRHLLLAAIAVTCLAVYGSFVPMSFKTLEWEQAVAQFKQVPYLELGVYKRADLVANIVLFVPLGFFWLGAIDLDRRKRWLSLLAVPLLGALLVALAITVEFFQQWTVRRTVSQNDMIAESVGAFIGMGLWFVAGRWLIGRVRAVLSPGEPVTSHEEQTAAIVQRWRRFLLLYALGFVIYNIQPLDLAFSPASLKQKAADGRVLLMPFLSLKGSVFNALWQIGSDILLFLPVGFLLRLGPRQPRSLPKATLLCLLAACGIELMQLFVFTRYVDTTDLFISTAGGFLGAWFAGRFLHARWKATQDSENYPRAPLALVIGAVYIVPLCIFNWQPFHFVKSMDEFWNHLSMAINMPFSSHYVGTEFNALTKVMRDVMYFAPFGVLCRWVCEGRGKGLWSGRVIVVLIGLLLGCVIEVGQAATITRVADITSVSLNVMGAFLGWWTWGLICRRPQVRGPERRRGTGDIGAEGPSEGLMIFEGRTHD